MLSAAGVAVTAHVPVEAETPGQERTSTSMDGASLSDGSSTLTDDSNPDSNDEHRPAHTTIASPSPSPKLTNSMRALQNGATGKVLVGDPLPCIASCPESSFDFVLDTVGGKRIWDASRWVMRSGGQFTTLRGDNGDKTPCFEGSSLKSSMRSIRSAMLRSDSSSSQSSSRSPSTLPTEGRSGNGSTSGKGYEWVMPNAELDTEGEDVRDSLAAVATLAQQGSIRPLFVSAAVPFEQTPEAFEKRDAWLMSGGVFVTRLIN